MTDESRAKQDITRELEALRRELELLGDKHSSNPELEYHLARLSAALHGSELLSLRFGLRSSQPPPELLAQIDALLSHTAEIRDLAARVREVLLRPPPEDKAPSEEPLDTRGHAT